MHSATTTDASVQGPYLAVYLNDHLAGSTAIVELVRRAAREHQGTELGGFLTRLGAEISQDRQALRRVRNPPSSVPSCSRAARRTSSTIAVEPARWSLRYTAR